MKTSLDRRTDSTPRVQRRGERLFWEPSAALRKAGFKGRALGITSAAALNLADELNAMADQQIASGTRAAPSTASAVFDAFLKSKAFTDLAASTAKQYRRHIASARLKFATTLAGQITITDGKRWLEELGGGRDAQAHVATLRRVLGWAFEEGKIPTNPLAGLDLGERARRRRVATRDELWAIVAAAERMGRPSLAAYAITAAAAMQRVGDVIELDRNQVQEGVLHLTQNKTGAKLTFRLHPLVIDRLGLSGRGPGPMFINEETGRPYSERGLQRAWDRARDLAAEKMPCINGTDPTVIDANHQGALALSDLRRSGMVWSAEGGAMVQDICSVSGHSIDEGMSILETYLPRGRIMADRAIARLDMVRTPTIEQIGLVAAA